MILVGKYCENEDNKEVAYEEGQSLENKYGIKFYEISCETGKNIKDIFYDSLSQISRKIEEGNNNFYFRDNKDVRNIRLIKESLQDDITIQNRKRNICL